MVNRTLRYGQTPDEAMGIGLRPRPNDPWSAAAATGLGGLTPSAADSLIQKMPESSIGDLITAFPKWKHLLQEVMIYYLILVQVLCLLMGLSSK